MPVPSIWGQILQSIQPSDYDMPGYVAKYGKPDQSKGQHLTDEFKLPNHMTFSSDSNFSKPGEEGGTWADVMGKWLFYPSNFNLQQHPADELQDYFNRREPNARLVLPKG